jgi:hypothetical protein
MKIKPILFFITVVFISNISFAGGWSSWHFFTPQQNELDHDGSSAYQIQFYCREDRGNTAKMPVFKKWYFYKNHIIAEFDNTFFYINEISCLSSKLYNNKESFSKIIADLDLKPKYITREFDAINPPLYISDMSYVLGIILIFLPLLMILCVFFLYFIHKSKYKAAAIIAVTYILLFTTYTGLSMLFEIYPHSI